MKQALFLFKNNLLLSLLVAVQLCASAVFGMIAFSVISDAFSYYNMTKVIDGAYVYTLTGEENPYAPSSAVMQYQESGEIELSRLRTPSISGRNPDANNDAESYMTRKYNIDRVHAYTGDAEKVMKEQLKKGRWYEKERTADGLIECVVFSKRGEFPIGSVIEGGQYSVRFNEGGHPEPYFKNKLRFKVVGYCGEEGNALTYNVYSSQAELDSVHDMFEFFTYKSPSVFKKLDDHSGQSYRGTNLPTVTIFCAEDALFCDEEITEYAGSENSFFSFGEGVSDARKEEILEVLKNEAGVASMHSLRQTEREVARATVLRYLPILLCFLSLIVVGVICVSVLNMIKNRAFFKIYFLCGMTLSRAILSVFTYAVLLLLISGALTLLVWTGMSVMHLVPWDTMNYSATVLFFVLNYLAFVLLNLGASVPMLKKYEGEDVK